MALKFGNDFLTGVGCAGQALGHAPSGVTGDFAGNFTGRKVDTVGNDNLVCRGQQASAIAHRFLPDLMPLGFARQEQRRTYGKDRLMMPGSSEWLIILGVAVLLFGPSKLPKLGGAIGESIRNFKKGMNGLSEELEGLEKDTKQLVNGEDKQKAKDGSPHLPS